ncbi:MAG: LacI family DNA-binding transcriptional regulator [Nibricoccus sp.]
MPKITLERIAHRAKVNRSTVSLALRNHPRISLRTRERVRKLAAEMGYHTDPLVTALTEAKRMRGGSQHAVIAYVTNYPTRYGWKPPYHNRPDYFPGTSERLAELGYHLEHFWLGEPGMTARSFWKILWTRGVRGIVIGRLPPGQSSLPLFWEHFPVVTVGMTLREPAIHRVTEDFYEGASKALQEMRALGYRRIGFVFSEENDSPLVGDRWLGAYLYHQLFLPRPANIPPLSYASGRDHFAEFRSWFLEHEPDAILATHGSVVVEWLNKMGYTVPEHVGVASLTDEPGPTNIKMAGISCAPGRLGSVAAEMMVGLIHRREKGIPANAHEVMLEGEWRKGETVRAQGMTSDQARGFSIAR